MGEPIDEAPGAAPPIVGVPLSAAAFAGRALDGAAARSAFVANGGNEATVLGLDDEQLADGSAGWLTALDAERVGLLHLARDGGWPSVEVLAAAARWCRERGVLLVADVREDAAGAPEAIAFADELRAAVGDAAAEVALYFPALRDGSTGGAVCGVIARTEVWRAPAGREFTIAEGASLSVSLSAPTLRALNDASVNALRELPAGSVVVWGARTLSTDAEWKFINIRRLLHYLERSIDEGTQWAAFEPNAEPLWTSMRRVVEDFLVGLWRDGALQGSTPKEAFFVRCDRTTMTQDDIDSGRLVVTVGFAPTRPAEFVIVEIGKWLVRDPPP